MLSKIWFKCPNVNKKKIIYLFIYYRDCGLMIMPSWVYFLSQKNERTLFFKAVCQYLYFVLYELQSQEKVTKQNKSRAGSTYLIFYLDFYQYMQGPVWIYIFIENENLPWKNDQHW